MNLKLKHNADVKSLIYIFITTALFITQWMWIGVNPFIYTWFLFMAVTVAVMTHNHNHLPMWQSKAMNLFTDWWLTVFYGFPIFAWIPTHNKNHHRFNNREGDDSITYRVSEKNNFLTLISYPTISGYYQQKAIIGLPERNESKQQRKILGMYIAVCCACSVDSRSINNRLGKSIALCNYTSAGISLQRFNI